MSSEYPVPKQVKQTFAVEGILARYTGHGNASVPGSSRVMIHFPHEPHNLAAAS